MIFVSDCICFFKQKTAYEMRISDWSSDVCSSDLGRFGEQGVAVVNQDVAWHLIDQEGHSDIHEAGELQRVSYAIGLSRAAVGEAEFERFNDALEALIADGSVAAILRRHGLEPAF